MDIPLTRDWIATLARTVADQADYLTQLDSAIGDADHGVNLNRGFAAVTEALAGYEAATVGDVLVRTGTTLVSRVGGASGPLYGTAFRAIGKALDSPTVDERQLAAGLRAGLEGLQRLGAAVPGDKTMVDAYVPALEAFEKDLDGGAPRQRDSRGGGRRRGRDAGHHRDAGAQGPGVLPRPAQRRPPGPGRHLDVDDVPVTGRGRRPRRDGRLR